jgi:hypothetical protein
MEKPQGWDEGVVKEAPPGWDQSTPATEPSPMSKVEGASPWAMGEMPTAKETKPFVRAGAQLLAGIPTSLAASPIAGGAAATLAGIGVDALYGDMGSPGGYAAEGLLNAVVPAGVAKGLDYFGKGAIRSALKIPPTQITREGANQVVDTMVKENLRVGAKGMEKGRGIVSDIEDALSKVINKSGSSVKVADVVKVMEAQKARFADSLHADKANAVIDDVIAKFTNHANVVNGRIPIDKAQAMKKATYQDLQDFYRNTEQLTPKKRISTNAESVAMAAEAQGLRAQIMSDPTIPQEATDWLKRESNVLGALKWIQRRANVAANMDPITFNDVLVGGLIHQGVPAAVAIRFVRMPAVMSQIGIWMAKAAPKAAVPLQAGTIGTQNLLSP